MNFSKGTVLFENELCLKLQKYGKMPYGDLLFNQSINQSIKYLCSASFLQAKIFFALENL